MEPSPTRTAGLSGRSARGLDGSTGLDDLLVISGGLQRPPAI
jgi:hypothetical protein